MLRRLFQDCVAFALLATLPTVVTAEDARIKLGGVIFNIELAVTPEEHRKGLMGRTDMPDNHGMLFVYSQAHLANFWMKNTLIPLDIMFFDEHGKMTHYYDRVQPCKTTKCPLYSSLEPIYYVLELSAGKRESLGVAPGDDFTILKSQQ